MQAGGVHPDRIRKIPLRLSDYKINSNLRSIMPPTKIANKVVSNGIATRRKTANHGLENDFNHIGKGIDKLNKIVRGKRKADCSPIKNKVVKRSALGDVTNNDDKVIDNKVLKNIKRVTVQSKVLPSVRTVQKKKQNENSQPPPAPVANKIVTRNAVKQVTNCTNQTALKPKENKKNCVPAATTKKRLSNEFEKDDETLYCTALEETNDSTCFSAKRPVTRLSAAAAIASAKVQEAGKSSGNISLVTHQLQTKLHLDNKEVPEGVTDYDKENYDDVYQVSHYAKDIFHYYREKELTFPISNYMDTQICITKWMRTLLVDWMVEIQESFELNHETLYLGVKLVDLYLSRILVSKETLQLVGATAMFVASKFDERLPPLIDDFLYLCDGAYTRKEIIKMEISLLRVVDFNLGIPISYRFLRRFARCSKTSMNILTLARYILEFSLMDYDTIHIRDSLIAAASLYLALRMKFVSKWTPTLEFYTGYKLNDLKSTVLLLNKCISKPPKEQIMTVRNKYSHKIFFEVAYTPLLEDQELF
ncbi:G2/mitotic-specific cyclin-B3-like isoform X1 [Dendroctonus ponderosae]|uniref:G2/mitotic-specific cyclin-B3 n=2 Tax=Dendroctonus ponderosae TaxID=77166 RepID=A0AAR5PTG3_DENPD|nr:G2/mitotic-specific cyclin-B3 isoform X1 [Dendroctonus ponderosae]XP_048525516.1 G2/mitotic-specific cyclin-B3-like isoform X1 [Dendroctonus ponderosae]KAH1014292.1 hypothetical protein HUJ04_003150 [Dendroctonus ponderosae]KAH1014293.1 hypothetical protein HUJ04_003150 [Dendroctonus ponderosae]